MTTFPIGFHSKRHDPDNALHRDPNCEFATNILQRCSCERELKLRCEGCFTRTAKTHWNLVKEVLSEIEMLLRPYPEDLPFPIAPRDLRVKTFVKSLNSGSIDQRTALLRRCEKAGLVEVEHHQDDYEPRIKSLACRGQQLLSALNSNIDRFGGWELEDPWYGL